MYERCAHAHYRPRITSIFMNKYGAQICILSQLLMEHSSMQLPVWDWAGYDVLRQLPVNNEGSGLNHTHPTCQSASVSLQILQ